MAGAVATKVFLSDVPVQYIRPFEIRLSRGWEPWRFAIGVTDDRFDNLKNPITIRIETVNEDGTAALPVFLEGWNITGKVRHDEYTSDIFIEDVRWNALYKKLSASYNVAWWGTAVARQGSDDDGSPWTTVDAIEDALKRFGLETDPNPQLDSEIARKELPTNLGPSDGGGFAGVGYLIAMPILAESAELDIVTKPNGHVFVTDRATDVAQQLSGYPAISGRVVDKDIHWSQPAKLEVLFPKQIERRFEYTERDPARTFSGPDQYVGDGATNNIENVIPEYDLVEFKTTWLEFYRHVQDRVFYARNKVLKRIHIPGIFPWGDDWGFKNLIRDAQGYAKFRWFETMMQDSWRSTFRVKKEFIQGTLFRPLANIQLGRLAVDGTNKGGGILMNYSRIHRYSHYPLGTGPGVKGGTMFDAEFSKNEPFSKEIPAPFEAQWISDDVDELIFQVVPKAKSRLDRQYWPGELVNPLQYGDIHKIATGQPIEIMEASAEFSRDFKMFVYYHGLQIEDLGSAVEGQRMHVVRLDMFSSGEGPTLIIKAGDITANFAHSEDHDLPMESDIINLTQVEEAADYIGLQIFESYLETKHGTIEFATMKPLVDEIQTNGNIYDTVIRIGMDQEYTATLSYMVMPSIPQIRTGRPRSGVPASKVDGG